MYTVGTVRGGWPVTGSARITPAGTPLSRSDSADGICLYRARRPIYSKL